MSGFPVVLSDNGAPVTPVASGAPVATISSHGIGTPVRITSGATPIVLEGIGPTPPDPGPLDFYVNGPFISEFEQEFGVASPQVVVALSFYYSGTPTFTITHNGESFDDVRVSLNPSTHLGCLIAIGSNITIEDGVLRVEVEGATIGGVMGRINEIPDGWQPVIASSSETSGSQKTQMSEMLAGSAMTYCAIALNVSPYVQMAQQLPEVKYLGSAVTGFFHPITDPATINSGWSKDADGWFTRDTLTQSDTPGKFDLVNPLPGSVIVFAEVDPGPNQNATQFRGWRGAYSGYNMGAAAWHSGPRSLIEATSPDDWTGFSMSVDVGGRFRNLAAYNGSVQCGAIFQSGVTDRRITNWISTSGYAAIAVQLEPAP